MRNTYWKFLSRALLAILFVPSAASAQDDARIVHLEFDSVRLNFEKGDFTFAIANFSTELNPASSWRPVLGELGFEAGFQKINADTITDFFLRSFNYDSSSQNFIAFIWEDSIQNYQLDPTHCRIEGIKYESDESETNDKPMRLFLLGIRLNGKLHGQIFLPIDMGMAGAYSLFDANYDGQEDFFLNLYGEGMNVMEDVYIFDSLKQNFYEDDFLSGMPNLNFDNKNKTVSTCIEHRYAHDCEFFKRFKGNWYQTRVIRETVLENFDDQEGNHRMEESDLVNDYMEKGDTLLLTKIVDRRSAYFDYDTESNEYRSGSVVEKVTAILYMEQAGIWVEIVRDEKQQSRQLSEKEMR